MRSSRYTKRPTRFQPPRHQKEQVLSHSLLPHAAYFSCVARLVARHLQATCITVHMLCKSITVLPPLPTPCLSCFSRYFWASLGNMHTRPREWHNKSRLLKPSGCVLANDMEQMHATDSNMFTLTEIFCSQWKKPPSVPTATKVAAGRERGLAKAARVSALFWRRLRASLLSFELLIITSWHALSAEYISFHVCLAFSQDLLGGGGLAFCLARSKAF